ncbi:MAG TPA: flagellar hook-associated protein FlgL [Pseudomonadales bacterium]|nr:flagellar hook-associated protein FlgL [Pseudomonadales bacterium]
MVRISSLDIFNIANSSMQKANSDISKTQLQLSSGQRVITPSDDPVASLKIMELDNELSRIAQYGKNIDSAENTLQQTEGLLDGVVDIIQRVRELSIQAGNTGVNTTAQYDALATEIEGRLNELVNIANSRDANGDFVFSGFKGEIQPFSGDYASGFKYHGDDGQRLVKTANNSTIPVSNSGRDVFIDIPSANNTVFGYTSQNNQGSVMATVPRVVDQDAYDAFYPEDMVITFNNVTDVTPPRMTYTITERATGNIIAEDVDYKEGSEIIVKGVSITLSGNPSAKDSVVIESSNKQDLMTTLGNLVAAMRDTSDDAAGKKRIGEAVANTLNNLNNAQTKVLSVMSSVGARQNSLQTTRELHIDSELFARQALSDMRDLDYAEASTRLAMQTMILEAAQASFVRVTSLSLFDRL